MQLLVSIFALLFLATSLFAQPAFPIKNGKLQSDLNAGGYYITNAAGITDVNGDPIVGGGGASTNGLATTNYVDTQVATRMPTSGTNVFQHVGQPYDIANATGVVQTLTVVTGAVTYLSGNGAGLTNISTNSIDSTFHSLLGGGSDISASSSNNMVSAWTAGDVVVSNASRVISQSTNFVFYYKGDLHAGTNGTGPDTGNGWPVLTNEFNRMLEEAPSLNVKAFYSAGDCWDDSLFDSESRIGDLTNQLWRFVSAGIPFISCIGNHEIDQGTTNYTPWANWMGPLLTASGLTAQSTNNDYTECLFLQTNSSLKMGFVTLRSGDTNTINWLDYCATNYPDHRLMVLIHSGLGGGENFPWVGSFFPAFYSRISKHPNIFAVNSGHYRDIWSWAHSVRQTENGIVTWLFMNTQSHTNAGAHVTRYYTFRPQYNVVEAKTYDAMISQFLTNGQMTTFPAISSNGIMSNFTFPIKGAGGNPYYTRLMGRGEAFTGRFNTNANAHVGSWSRAAAGIGFATNELFDTALTFDRRSNYGGFDAIDSFAIGRFWASNELEFVYSPPDMRDHFHSGIKLGKFSTNGTFTAAAFAGNGAGLTNLSPSIVTNSAMLIKTVLGTANYTTNTTAATPEGYWLPYGADYLTNYADFAMTIPVATNATIPIVQAVVTEIGTLTGNARFYLAYEVVVNATGVGSAPLTGTAFFTNAVGQANSGYRASLVSLSYPELTNAFTAQNAGKMLRLRFARDSDDAADTITTNLVLLANPTVLWGEASR